LVPVLVVVAQVLAVNLLVVVAAVFSLVASLIF
jgi:hypothetical protein